MAAVRRSSDSGLVVALVIFVVIAVGCLGGAVWFYQQFEKVCKATSQVQDDFGSKVASIFQQENWQLTKQQPGEGDWGIVYVGESFDDVAGKLREAAEYEELQNTLLGWKSLQGVADSLEKSDLQVAAAERGDPQFSTVQDLLGAYESQYRTLSNRVSTLETENTNLRTERDNTRQKSAQDLADLRRQNTQLVTDFNQKAGDLEAANAQLDTRVKELTTEAQNWHRQQQQEADARRKDVTDLKAQVDQWREKYEEAVAGPGEREVLVAVGKVLEVNSTYDFVVIEGGENVGVKPNERFVVYSVLPDGSQKRKGVILVSEVKDVTSVATIASEEAGSYILKGDSYVSQDRWQQFHREQATVAAAEK